MKQKYIFPSGESVVTDRAGLNELLEQNMQYLQNYSELLENFDTPDYVARGNGFCENKFSESFLNMQMKKYADKVKQIQKWIDESGE